MRLTIAVLGMVAALAPQAGAADKPPPLPPEKTPNVLTLPAQYPANWIFTNNYQGAEIIDITAHDPGHVRGRLGAGQFPNLQVARTRPETYVAETFYARGTRGQRTDVVTIYDNASLAPSGEIVLTGSYRYLSSPQPNAFQLSGDESLGFLFGFTPAAYIKVLDLKARTMLSEIPIPGCALAYPTGARGFSTLCNDGTMLSLTLDDAGHVASQTATKAFNDLTDDPLFNQPAMVGTVAYFASLKGQVQPVDLAGPVARVLDPWPLLSAEEAKADWRPSGWQVAAADGAGRLYVIMQPHAKDGSHKDGGPEVWVYDLKTRAKVATIKLRIPADSISISGGDHPVLLAGGMELAKGAELIDTYDLASGAHLNTLSLQTLGTAVMFPVRR
jgi:methylamine dehydrogenase heavy chain